MQMEITLERSEAVVAACKAKANELGVPMTIAVVDTGGNLAFLARMDNTLLAGLDIAIGKAFTAVAMRMSTVSLAEYVQPGQALYGLPEAHSPRHLVPFGGGIPLSSNGELIGGVGVAGGSPEQDNEVAQAALQVMT
jgi:uncharacterized protein GlcG (DUF336 family)